MGLSNFPSPAEGVLPLLVMNTVMSVALVKSTLRSMLQLVGAVADGESQEEYSGEDTGGERARRVSVTRYDSLCSDRCGGSDMWQPAGECCVCLCGFKGDEEVSELSCKHFFHRGCLDKWFDKYQHITCPLCRSVW